jgi:predicted nucleic acid-binding protein
MRYLLDTNTLIYFMDGTLTTKGFEFVLKALEAEECALSVISKIEVLGFPFPSILQEQQAAKFVKSLRIYHLTEDVVEKTIEIRKSIKPKIADAIIAATAILHGFTLISRNEKDFKHLHGLNFINPFDL